MNEDTDDELMLVLKCRDPKFGDLYALNKEISTQQKDLVIDYFKNYKLDDYEDIMEVEGNPVGWMCKEEDVEKVEELLSIKNTLKNQQETLNERKKVADARTEKKDKAMEEIISLYSNADKPPQKFLKKLLKKADIVYDPADQYYYEHDTGEGQLFLVDKQYIWYIINNGSKDADYSVNNIKTDGPGAVGLRLPYSEKLHNLIKIFSDDNLYKK
ncbi:MAG: hypothetical protein LUG89_02465 [Methanosphaera sp.]|nr:hypothetical protein [Methanosphaera sp.]